MNRQAAYEGCEDVNGESSACGAQERTTMRLKTRLTKALGIEHPVLLAPMNVIAGGRLAAAVSNAGGLGIIGGVLTYLNLIGSSSSLRQREVHGSAAGS